MAMHSVVTPTASLLSSLQSNTNEMPNCLQLLTARCSCQNSKTYTMLGATTSNSSSSSSTSSGSSSSAYEVQLSGVIPQALRDLFAGAAARRREHYTLSVSYLEVSSNAWRVH
jgi:hypothetical protein